ncbi:MAG TPA: ATP-binding protein, partial [Ramlibacter sp.]
EQLLTLSRLEAGAAPGGARVDLAAVVRSAVAEVAPAALASGQVVEVETGAAVMVAGDEVLLHVLVRNLVDNAARYSPPRARVEVHVAAEDGRIELAVEDSGPGLPDADLARLGQRFFRVAGNEAAGSGLGWSIVRRIADLHGAQVAVRRSAALGGLAVRISFPAAPPPVSERRGRP